MMRTILWLNLMREEAKLPLRTHYAIIVVGENKKPRALYYLTSIILQ